MRSGPSSGPAPRDPASMIARDLFPGGSSNTVPDPARPEQARLAGQPRERGIAERERRERVAVSPPGAVPVEREVVEVAERLERLDPLAPVRGELDRTLRQTLALRDREAVQGAVGRGEEVRRAPAGAARRRRRSENAASQWCASSSANSAERSPLVSLDPRRQLGVRAAALPPRQALVGDVADEDVLEDELALAGRARTKLRSSTSSRRRSVCSAASRSSTPASRSTAPSQKTRPTTAARCATRFSSGASRSSLARMHRLDGVGDLDLVDSAAQRASGRPSRRAAPRRSGGGRSPRGRTGSPPTARGSARAPSSGSRSTSSSDETRRALSLGRQRVERQRAEAAAATAPVRPGSEQIRPRRAKEEDRPLDTLGELVEDVEHRGVRPVDVLDDDHDAGSPRDRHEQRAPRRHQLTVGLARVEGAERVAGRAQAERRRERRDGVLGRRARRRAPARRAARASRARRSTGRCRGCPPPT